jgi:hypothetical protein
MNLNELHIESNPKLLFMANSINNKGQSHKSYTIRIVNDQYNDEQLDQIFSINHYEQSNLIAHIRLTASS